MALQELKLASQDLAGLLGQDFLTHSSFQRSDATNTTAILVGSPTKRTKYEL